MYGQGQGNGVVAGAATAAGVAALPNTGNNIVLSVIAISAIVCGLAAIAMQLVISGYRRRALKSL
jgi:hypothetical protein